MKGPLIGDLLYRDRHGEWPVTVIAVRDGKAFYVDGHVDIGSTHVGNLFNDAAERPYYA